MVDVELEVIDLSTGQSVGSFQLTICEAKAYELDTGSYRFRATYLATGEVKESDISIVEGVNPPLEFTFAASQAPTPPAPPIEPLFPRVREIASAFPRIMTIYTRIDEIRLKRVEGETKELKVTGI